jgi:hypothetical protein
MAQGPAGAANTKDLLVSRPLVYDSLTLTMYDSLPVYARVCVQPMAGLSTGGSGQRELAKEKEEPRARRVSGSTGTKTYGKNTTTR